MNSPTPNTPLTLRAILLTSSSLPPEPRLPSIRFRITPHFLVPDCIVSPLINSYNIGHCVETIVPMGGKVEVGLTVDEESLSDCGIECENPSSRVMRGVTESFRLNAQSLSLSTMAPIAQSRLDRSTFLLTPLASTPSNNLLLTHMIPTGHPICYLKRFDIHCSWTMTRTGGALKRPVEDAEYEDGQAQEDIIDDLMILDDHGSAVPDQTGSNDEDDGQIKLLPEDRPVCNWLDHLIGNACQKLLLRHFLRRFPLIFDGRFTEALPKYILPSQLISSVSQFAWLSTAYDTPLHQKIGEIMKKVTWQQQEFLSLKLDQTVNLPARKDRKLEASQRRQKRLKQAKQDRDQLDRIPKEKGSPEDEDEAIIGINRRKERYMEQLKASMDASDNRGMRRDERKISRIIGDAIGLICRSDFEMRRNRGGRLSAAGTKFQYPTDDAHQPLPISDAQLFLTSRANSNAASDTSRDESFIENALENNLSYEVLVDDQEEWSLMRPENTESFAEQQEDEDEDVDVVFIMDDGVDDDQEDDDLLPIESWPLEESPKPRVVPYHNQSKEAAVVLRIQHFEEDTIMVDGDDNMDFEILELEATFVDQKQSW
ncbi:hypothetical protein I308_103153 [Cryptococcus tetragattii IND107]|uniref:Uncharacterized protein n=1 Tax=Cryptococcus tetragattii IND107 TaxID=1296105 RepID=A0ABR3BSC4_9TREE